MPLTVGPDNMAEDEKVIAKGYRDYGYIFNAALPFVVASFADTKWVVAAGFGCLILMANARAARLHDLSIRHRRTNKILEEIHARHFSPIDRERY
jgi:hypothetical protein